MHIKLDDNSKKAILRIDGNKSYEFVIKEDKDKLKIYPNEVSLESVMAVYRNLRENYEYRLRYDEAGNYSGHGVLNGYGDHYLAPSEIDPYEPDEGISI